ncbi:hypothetical protein MNBD_GAMMA08-2991 [hydrothermal vent metagenome]|uniref:Uncharacterized protein n=1 Tax=hydrothermal vent metagenome TaxID=652676 RepID=A0A3B0XAC7_9ZZZZ
MLTLSEAEIVDKIKIVNYFVQPLMVELSA